MRYAFLWGLVLVACGWLSWPLISGLAKGSPLRGLGIAQVLGLVLAGYLYWALGHLIETRSAIWLSAALLTAGGCVTWGTDRDLWRWVKLNWRRVLLFQTAVLGLFLALAFLRRGFPQISHSEQPMNLAMLSGVIRADRMPPGDLWLAGEGISYYYLGYVLWGWLTTLTRTPIGIAFNLALGGVMTLAWAALSELLTLLWPRSGGERRALLGGLLGAAAVLLSSNLAGLILIGRSLGLVGDGLAQTTGMPDLLSMPLGEFPPRHHWWWWQASRVSRDITLLGRPPDVISEFPAFSWLLGDLHPHYMVLPLSLAVVGLVVLVSRSLRGSEVPWRGVLLAGWLIGCAGLCSIWELPMLIGLTLATWSVLVWRGGSWRQLLICIVLATLAGLLPFLPFWAAFDSQAAGVSVNWMARSRLRSLVLVIGLWLPTLLLVRVRRRSIGRYLLLLTLALALPLGATLVVGGWGRMILSLASTLATGLPSTLCLAAIWAWLAACLLERSEDSGQDGLGASLLLGLAGISLLYAAEYVRVGDLFGTRMNTLFKLSYQAWWLLACAAVIAGARCLHGSWRRGVALVSAALVILSAGYLALGVGARTAAEWGDTIDGLAHLWATSPDEVALADWLEENAASDDVLLAAPGRSYHPEDGRLAAISGVPVVLGWQGHEEQWHSSTTEVRVRAADIDRFYSGASDAERRAILGRYAVTLVLVGPRERTAYGLRTREIERIAALCPLVMSQGEWALYDCAP